VWQGLLSKNPIYTHNPGLGGSECKRLISPVIYAGTSGPAFSGGPVATGEIRSVSRLAY
jgi:hypothetical protein